MPNCCPIPFIYLRPFFMGDPFVDRYIRERKEKGGTTAGEQSGTKEEEGMFNGVFGQ